MANNAGLGDYLLPDVDPDSGSGSVVKLTDGFSLNLVYRF